MDNSQQFVQQIEQKLIKSTRDHIDKQTQRLISYFGEEFKFTDPLNLIGKRFKDKEADFQAMKQNNSQLLLKTRNLAEEIQRLRGSLNKSQHEDMNPFNKTEKIQNLSSSKFLGRQFQTNNSQIIQKMKEINKTIQVTRQDYLSYAQEYDQLLEHLFSYISRQKNVQKLHSQIMKAQQGKHSNNEEERVLVPKKRYEKLIQIYAINMADISVNQFRRQINSSGSSISDKFQKYAINYEEQSKRVYKQKYSDIAKDQNIDTKDLFLLFRALARKVGLQKQWERYHLNNTNQAVKLKSKIQFVFKLPSEIDSEIKDNKNDGQAPKPIRDGQFIQKLNKVVSQIPMSLAQKQKWDNIKKKIDEDRLMNIEKIVQQFEKMIKTQNNQIIEKASLLVNTTITKSLQSFSKLIETKLRAKGAKLTQKLDEISIDNLKKSIETKFDPSKKNVWQICGQVTKQKIEEAFKKLSKNIVFLSSGSLYQTLAHQN